MMHACLDPTPGCITCPCPCMSPSSLQVVAKLQAEVHALQVEVKEKESAAMQEDKKMRELKKAQRELKQQNTKLSAKLSIAQVQPWMVGTFHQLSIAQV